MKLRFFGDSWAWSWQPISSKRIADCFLKDQSNKTTGPIPFIEIYLKHFGIESVIHNQPGLDFENVVRLVLDSFDHSTVDYNIILVPSIWRGLGNTPTLSNHDKFIEEWNAKLKQQLSILNDWAIKHNQTILLFGGQTTIKYDTFRQCIETDRIHLVAECITSYLTYKRYQGSDFNHGILKINSDICSLVNETWDSRLVDHLYNDLKHWENDQNIRHKMWPDKGHLNAQGLFEFVDIMLTYIEKLEEEK